MINIAKYTIGVMIATIFAKILGFVRKLVLASSYGVTMCSHAYLVGINVALIILTSLGVALATSVILYTMKLNLVYNKKGIKVYKYILNIVLIIYTIILIIRIKLK